MRCLLHNQRECCPDVPVYVYLSWLRVCKTTNYHRIAKLLTSRAHIHFSRVLPDAELITCPSCRMSSSVHSVRLKGWSVLQCGYCLASFCARCRECVPPEGLRWERVANNDKVMWRAAHNLKRAPCACPPPPTVDIVRQVNRSLSALTGVDVHSPDADDVTETTSPVLKHLLSLHPLAIKQDAYARVPMHPEHGLDVLDWLHDEVEDADASVIVSAFLRVVSKDLGSYCVRLHPFWSRKI